MLSCSLSKLANPPCEVLQARASERGATPPCQEEEAHPLLVTENCAFQHLHLATFTPAAPTTLDVAALAAGAGGDASDRAVATAPAIAAATCAPPASATIVGVPTFARTVAASPPLEPPPAPPPRRAPTATSRTMPPPTLPVTEVVATLQEGQVRPPGGGSTQSEKGQMIMKVLKLLLRRGDRRSCSRAPCSRARGNTTKAKNARKEGKKPAKGRKKKAKARRKETMNGKDLWDTSNMIKDANVNGLKREHSKGKDGDDESHFSLKVTKFKTRGRTRAITEKNMANMREPLEIDKSSGGDAGRSSDNENERNVSGCTTTAPNAKESETQQQGQCEKAESEIELSEELKQKNDSGESGRENKEVTENAKEEEQEGNNNAAVGNNNNDECDNGSEGKSVAKSRPWLKWV